MLNENELTEITNILSHEILKYEIESDFFTTTISIKPVNTFVLIDSAALVNITKIKPFLMSLNKDFTIELVF
jgi:hypothetical protein